MTMRTSTLLPKIIETLNRPLFGTRVIPPGVAVPAVDFPEDEYAVFCPGCDYLLRGLASEQCPECGRPFNRGQLLVDQYVRERDHRVWKQGGIGRWAGRIAAFVLGFLLIYIAAAHLAALCLPWLGRTMTKATARQVDAWVSLVQTAHELMWWGQLVLLAILLASVGVWLRAARRNARKRRRILDALP